MVEAKALVAQVAWVVEVVVALAEMDQMLRRLDKMADLQFHTCLSRAQ